MCTVLVVVDASKQRSHSAIPLPGSGSRVAQSAMFACRLVTLLRREGAEIENVVRTRLGQVPQRLNV